MKIQEEAKNKGIDKKEQSCVLLLPLVTKNKTYEEIYHHVTDPKSTFLPILLKWH